MLDVYLYGARVAELRDAGSGELSIAYTDTAIDRGNAARLSLSLPVRSAVYPSRRGGNRWVRSILPEMPLRDQVAAKFAMAPDDHSGLLMRIGRDVAGAVVIVPAGEDPAERRAGTQPISEGEIATRIYALPESPFGIDGTSGVRLSLAGQQAKLLLVRVSDGWELPLYGYPSTTIIKPEPGRYPGLVTNELFSLNLAVGAGIDTAVARFEMFGGHKALAVDRYDRERDESGAIRRLHQEDVLSALGVDSRYKYERDDEYGHRGPSLVDIAGLISTHVGRLRLMNLLDIVTYNIALGNADAHARNLSLMLAPDGSVRIAPLYDVVCTVAYPMASTGLSQRIAGRFSIDDVTTDDLVAEAAAWGLTEGIATRRVDRFLTSMEHAIGEASEGTVIAGGDESVVASLAMIVRERLDRIR